MIRFFFSLILYIEKSVPCGLFLYINSVSVNPSRRNCNFYCNRI
jgi:hypothetical protein